MAAKASLVQREVARRSRDGGIVGRYYDLVLSLFSYGASLQSPGGGAESPEGDGRYACPAGAYFCSCKSRQNTLGAQPQDPLTLKLRLDTNDAKASSVRRRRYAPKVPAAHFILAPAGTELKLPPYKRRLAPDPGGCRPSGRGYWGPRKVARPCGERRMHCSGEGCPKQSIGSARLKRRLRPTSVGSLGRSPK